MNMNETNFIEFCMAFLFVCPSLTLAMDLTMLGSWKNETEICLFMRSMYQCINVFATFFYPMPESAHVGEGGTNGTTKVQEIHSHPLNLASKSFA